MQRVTVRLAYVLSVSKRVARTHTCAPNLSKETANMPRRQQRWHGGGRAAETRQGSGTGVEMRLVGPKVFGSRTLEVDQNNADWQHI